MILESAVLCLALNVYHEARGESIKGQHAVAQVTMNRANWKNVNVCKVVTAPKQFSWTTGLVSRRKGQASLKLTGLPTDWKAWLTAYQVAEANIKRQAPMVISRKVDHYHTPAVSPYWKDIFTRVARIGGHIFYKQS